MENRFTPPARLLCPSTRLYLGPGTRGRARGGGSGGGLPPPRHGCCVQASDYTWDPARGGVLEGGGPGGGVTPPWHGCCVQAPDYIWDPARGGVLEGVPPPGSAAVSKHQTVTFVFVLKITLPRRNLASLCPGRREVRPRISTPLQHLRF